MASPYHADQLPIDGIHVLQRWLFANAADRIAFVNEVNGAATPVADEVGAVARQMDNDTFWLLVDNAPLTWAQLGGSGSGSGHTIQDEGVDQNTRAALNFVGAMVAVSDNAGADSSDIKLAVRKIEPVTAQNISTDTALADTLDFTPLGDDYFDLFRNGLREIAGAGKAFTRSGTTLTWLGATGNAGALLSTDELIAVYWVAG